MKIFYNEGVKEQEVSSLKVVANDYLDQAAENFNIHEAQDKNMSEKFICFTGSTLKCKETFNVYEAQMSSPNGLLEVLVTENPRHQSMSIIIRHEYDMDKLVTLVYGKDEQPNQNFKLIQNGKDITPPISYYIRVTDVTLRHTLTAELDDSDEWVWEW